MTAIWGSTSAGVIMTSAAVQAPGPVMWCVMLNRAMAGPALDLGRDTAGADEPAWRIGQAAGWNQMAGSGSVMREQFGGLLIGEEVDDELVDDVGFLHRHTVGSARDDGHL